MFEKWKTITISQENIKSSTHIISNLRYAIPGEVSIIMCNGQIRIFISLLSFWPEGLIKSNLKKNRRKYQEAYIFLFQWIKKRKNNTSKKLKKLNLLMVKNLCQPLLQI